MRLPSLRAIQAFDAVARHRSFSRAADELAVTHGAVSRQVRSLEEQLGMRLFERLPKGAKLTDSGQALYRSSREAFACLQSGIADLTRHSTDKTVTVSLPTSLALNWLVPRLTDFRRRHPDYAVHLDTNDSVVDFQCHTLDVALRYGRGDWEGLQASLLANDELVAVAAPRLLENVSLPLDVDDLLKMPLANNYFRPNWVDWIERFGPAPYPIDLPAALHGNSGVLIAAALDGQGVALVRRLLVADNLAQGRLVQVSNKALRLDGALHFVCRPGDKGTFGDPLVRNLAARTACRSSRDTKLTGENLRTAAAATADAGRSRRGDQRLQEMRR